MLVISPFHPGDADQALRLFRWICELEGRHMPHDLMLIADSRCSPAVVKEIEAAAKQSFRSVETLSFVDHYKRWPDAPNAVFSMAARHVMANQRVPWLFLEPDCCPLKSGWLDAIEAEYNVAGKPFMGARVEVNDVPLHCSGNAVYPVDMFAHAGNALIAGDIAWDVAAASQIVPQAHFTKLIEHSWKRDPVTRENLQVSFDSWDQVEREVSKEAVIYHACKNDSLIARLRERKNNLLSVPKICREIGVKGDGGGQHSFTTDILIKSYPPDYERLAYCLRSIDKFANGFRRVVVVVPVGDTPWIPTDGGNSSFGLGFYEIARVEETGEPYLFQQTIKANAHTLTDADYILHLDSDCILTEPITPETFFRDGKPIWMMTPYAHIQKGIDAQKAADPSFHCGSMTWKAVTEKFMREPVEYELMRRMPMFVPRALHVAAAEFCKLKHGMSLTDYILSQPAKEFSEFNALGALAYSCARDDFYWLDTTKEPLPESVCIQKWSHEPFSDETKAEFEKILIGGDGRSDGDTLPRHGNAMPVAQPSHLSANEGHECTVGKAQEPATATDQILSGHGEQQPQGPNVDPLPAQTIQNGRSAHEVVLDLQLQEIRELAEALKRFCTSGPRTRRVREELHRLQVIELPYRMKKRKGWRKRKAKA